MIAGHYKAECRLNIALLAVVGDCIRLLMFFSVHICPASSSLLNIRLDMLRLSIRNHFVYRDSLAIVGTFTSLRSVTRKQASISFWQVPAIC